jgi:hypothetical protein
VTSVKLEPLLVKTSEGNIVSKGACGSLLGAVVLLFALVAAGCGGGDDTTESLSKSQFLKQGNAICKKGEEERGKLIIDASGKMKKEASVREQEDLVLEVLPTYENTTRELDDLGAPEGDEEKVDAIVEAMEEAVEKVEANPGSALVASYPFKEPNELVEKYGLKSCVA